MSLKWERVKAWDDQFFPAWAWPMKAALRALSSIWLAVVLLSGVILYGILASVPIGMLALIPTWLVYALTFAIGVGGPAILVVCALAAMTRSMGRAPRFVLLLLSTFAIAAAAACAWLVFLWPILYYHPPTGAGPGATPASGFRLFPAFVEANKSITLRRLPGVEMTELEFYSAWPMRALLLVFVLNMVVATIRRISFEFVNLGVLTVHVGIVLLALGATFYSSQKREGDTLLQAGTPDDTGKPTPGPAVPFFYDNTQTVLVVDQWRGPEQRRLPSLPRYNDYAVLDTPGQSVWTALGRRLEQAAPDGGALSVPIESWRGPTTLVDPDIQFRMVGYASYATAQTDWIRTDPARSGVALTGKLNPLRLVTLRAILPERRSEPPTEVPFYFMPTLPAHRAADTPAFAIEYRTQPSNPLDTAVDPTLELPLSEAGLWGLWVRVPGASPDTATGSTGQLWTLEPGRVLEVAGYKLQVTEITPEPPFPIVTEGYRGATSSVAQVRVTPPNIEGQPAPTPYTRWVYSRFPEINQDLLELSEEQTATGMPARRDADPSIELRLIDASKLHVTILEGAVTSAPAAAPESAATAATPASPSRETVAGRVIIRQRGGGIRTLDLADLTTPFEILPDVTLALTERWMHAEAFERPVPVAPADQDREAIGTHQKAMVAIEVSLLNRPDWKRVLWLPFVQYLELGAEQAKTIDLPDGRRVRLVFARRQHRLPGFQLRLDDFQMLAYDHRGAPRDYQSIVIVEPATGDSAPADFEPFAHITKLNAPLTAPWIWDPQRPLPANIAGRLAAGLNPNQFKFSQAGWDAEGWRESQALVDQGLLPRPVARFTILGVGNAPGIHVIALGGILMALGTPWAFYVKPWLVRRKRDRLAARAGKTTDAPRHREEP